MFKYFNANSWFDDPTAYATLILRDWLNPILYIVIILPCPTARTIKFMIVVAKPIPDISAKENVNEAKWSEIENSKAMHK